MELLGGFLFCKYLSNNSMELSVSLCPWLDPMEQQWYSSNEEQQCYEPEMVEIWRFKVTCLTWDGDDAGGGGRGIRGAGARVGGRRCGDPSPTLQILHAKFVVWCH